MAGAGEGAEAGVRERAEAVRAEAGAGEGASSVKAFMITTEPLLTTSELEDRWSWARRGRAPALLMEEKTSGLPFDVRATSSNTAFSCTAVDSERSRRTRGGTAPAATNCVGNVELLESLSSVDGACCRAAPEHEVIWCSRGRMAPAVKKALCEHTCPAIAFKARTAFLCASVDADGSSFTRRGMAPALTMAATLPGSPIARRPKAAAARSGAEPVAFSRRVRGAMAPAAMI